MALKSNFYNEIFLQEQKWIELINNNLLNSIYCNLALKPFYLDKKEVLEQEYYSNNNVIIGQVLSIIDNIVKRIEGINEDYNNLKEVDIKVLLPLFLTNQMNNTTRKTEVVNSNENIDRLQIRKQILENQIGNFPKNEILNFDDYLYEDFPEEQKRIK